MGCNSSKNKVQVVETAPTTTSTPGKDPKRKKTSSAKRRSKKNAMGSQDSLGGASVTSENRQGSASSKVSKHTIDSGFDDSEYQNVITENSDPSKVKHIEDTFQTPRDLIDFGVSGKAVSQRLSAKDRERFESQRILAALHEEGLIQRPVAKTTAGVSFEVIADTSDILAPPRPPARLAKLEKRRKKKKRVLTQEEIDEKLARAEERRKRRENQKLERIQDVSYKSDVQNAMETFEQKQQEVEEKEKSKQDVAAENRERRLTEMRDKLRMHKEKVEAAKRKKSMAQLSMDEEQQQNSMENEESPFGQSKTRITEDTPISASNKSSYLDYITQ